ncbi:MAG TPA: BTAD domain-containing putative transcriptional regulator [Candidatus Limnocylindrales bacterium]|nr:BTAD domain-containing putative transcriptional regulator [Candidatus Limnocylindrales bacterium]
MDLRSALLDRVERARPRIVRVVAGAGWGKSTFARALAARMPSAAVIECVRANDREHCEALLLDALAKNHASLGATSLWEAWTSPGPPALVVFEDVHLLDEHCVDVMRSLLRTLPDGRMLVLTSRAPLETELSRYFAPHEIVSLSAEDLAFTEAERRALIDDGRLDPKTLEHAVRLSRGWPISTFLFGRLAREGRLPELLDRLEDRAFDDLYAYTENEIVAELEPADVDVLLLCASSSSIEIEDVRAVLGPDAIPRLERLVSENLYITQEGSAYRAPIVGASLLRNRPADVAAMRARCAAARDERGDHCSAAELWLENGDPDRAAASLDRLGPPLPSVLPSRAYLRMLARIPLGSLLRTRHAFVVLLSTPVPAVWPLVLEARIKAVVESLEPDMERDYRISAKLALATVSIYVSQLRYADEILSRLDVEHRREPFPPERASLFFAARAALWAARGRTVDASALWSSAQLDTTGDRTVYEAQRYVLRVAVALSAGERDRVLSEVARQRAFAIESRDPVAIAIVRVMERIFTPVTVEHRLNIQEFLRAIEREELARADPAEYEHIVRAGELPAASRNVFSCIVLMTMAYEQSDPATARRMLDEAIASLDRIGRPHYQIQARLLLAFVPGAPRANVLDEARRIAAEVQDPRTLESVEAIAAGRLREARCFPFAARRIGRARFDVPEASLRVEIMNARVMRAGVPVALRAREFEVLAALALARTPLAGAALAARLWGEHDAGQAAPALRTAIHRLRKQLGDPSAVLFEHGAYRLGDSVTVDVHDLEAELGALRRLDALTERESERLEDIGEALAFEPPELYRNWDWMQPELAYLGELRHRAAMLIGEKSLAAGSPERAIVVADALLRVEPLDEPVVELSVRALLAADRHTEAVRRARRYADELTRELGGEPVSDLLRALAKGRRERAAV